MGAADPIHIRGMGLSCALGRGVEVCAQALESGAVNVSTLRLDELLEPIEMSYYRIPDGTALFDPVRFDPLLLEAVREAIAAADLSRAELEALPLFLGSSVFAVGDSEAQYKAFLRQKAQFARVPPLVGFQQLTNLIRQEFGCGGENYAFNTACTASANALMIAARMIRLGIHRHALVLGVELANETTLAGFCGLQLVADAVRPFDRRRSGIVLGEGVGAVVLSADPSASGVTLVAGACNGDGFSVTAANPDGSTIAAVQSAALRQADLEPARIRGIKSHGTASPMNDTGEAAGILRVFQRPPPVCALKPYLGHTLGACGVNELVLMTSALERGFFPGSAGFEEADLELGLTPQRAPSEAPPGHYLLNYFGFGGNNASLVLHKSR